ncbi:MAG: phosphate ABC transporter, permease protein PstA, partial [Solibacillus isronensis]
MRQFKDNMFRGLLWGSAFVSVAVLVVIVGYIFYKGFSYISFDFIFGDYSPTGGGGIFPMIVTTILTIVISLLIATPIGIL